MNTLNLILKNMEQNKMTFRFDDVSVNEDMSIVFEIAHYLAAKFKGCDIIFGLSPLVHSGCGRRVFPKVFNALADYRKHYTVDKFGMPNTSAFPNIIWAGHGIVHINHQLLNKQAQELSILTSCSLAGGKIFIPPWNKWNHDTEDVCAENGIELIKFEDGWRGCEWCDFDIRHNLWYLHGYAWTLDKFKEWLCA